jgi:crotonobetainyl-CoA:carnitine CoA-transferase CaiB-like acyl-CoA transferase
MLQRERIEQSLPPHQLRPKDSPVALPGIRVIDFTQFVSGPMGTQILADFGADVIKIEPPSGDSFRRYPPLDPDLPTQGAPFLWTNRNKRSVAIDLKQPEGQALVRELIVQADVLVENFSTGVMERFGLGYETCAALNPKLVYCAISAYGRTGRFADRLGFDSIVMAESGFTSMNGYPDRDPVRSGSAVIDISTGLMAGNAILAALMARHHTGKGQFVDIAMMDCALTMVGYAAMQVLCSGTERERCANMNLEASPAGMFRSSDKLFVINCGTTPMFQQLFRAFGREDIAADPELQTAVQRVRSRERIERIAQENFIQRPWVEWKTLLHEAGIPAGEVRSLSEGLMSEEAQERMMVTRVPHEKAGWLPNVALPFKLSGTPMVDPVAAPALGEHTAQVLSELLNLDETEIHRLKCAGILAGGADHGHA